MCVSVHGLRVPGPRRILWQWSLGPHGPCALRHCWPSGPCTSLPWSWEKETGVNIGIGQEAGSGISHIPHVLPKTELGPARLTIPRFESHVRH